MHYKGIDYDCAYTGRIVLGIGPDPKRHGRTDYQTVLELAYEEGILMDTSDITEIWRQRERSLEADSAGYWWGQEKKQYDYRINYGFMGAGGPLDTDESGGSDKRRRMLGREEYLRDGSDAGFYHDRGA